MTVTQLIRQLEALKAKHGNLSVTVNKPELFDGNGTWDVCTISSVTAEWVPLADEDGGIAHTKAGHERGSMQFVLGNK